MTNPPDDAWRAAAAYEDYMGRWSRPLARAFVAWLAPPGAAHWLEMGCGTGALTAALLADAAPASIVACDPSAPFVDLARRQLPDPRATFVVAGAEAPPRRDGGFDAVVSALVLNFLPDPAAALATLRARLCPGGLLAASAWDYAVGMEFLRHFWDAAAALDPAALALDEGRRFPLCRPEALRALFESAGLSDVVTGALEIDTTFADFDDYWTPFLRGTGPAPAYVAALDGPARERLRLELHRRLPADADGRLRLRARAWAVRGRAAEGPTGSA